jgi:AcrR family transcriptional regulator
MEVPGRGLRKTGRTMTADARERILNATLRLVGERGIGAVTNRAVATAAGVSLGSLTYHFPSQADLLRECLTRYVDLEIEQAAKLADGLAAEGATRAEAAAEVERFIAGLPSRLEQVATLELHLHASRDPAMRPAAIRSVAAYERLAAAVLTALAVPDAERHAPTFVALLYGLAVRRLAIGDTEASGTAEALTLFLRGATRGD